MPRKQEELARPVTALGMATSEVQEQQQEETTLGPGPGPIKDIPPARGKGPMTQAPDLAGPGLVMKMFR